MPFATSYYYTDVITMLFINIILVSSFRLITLTGNWNLAQIPLMGVGAYSSALITGSLGWPFWLAQPREHRSTLRRSQGTQGNLSGR